jgi:hypothetical protein
MGEITKMILEGLLDEQTGEYIGDQNKVRYGEEAPGFPVSYRDKKPLKRRNKCPICGKLCASGGLQQHIEAKHSGK